VQLAIAVDPGADRPVEDALAGGAAATDFRKTAQNRYAGKAIAG
jgi:hypothetical protein